METYYTSSGPFSAVSWSNGVVRRLGPISADTPTLALDINASGLAAGTIYELPPSWAQPGGSTVPQQGGRGKRVAGRSLAQALNNRGEVVINSPHEDGWWAYLYTRGRIVNLGLLRHHNSIYGLGINNKGHVVGFSQNDQEQGAFLYANGELHDLNQFISSRHGLRLQGAYAINDREQIVGIAQPRHGPPRAFILTPREARSTTED